MTALSSEFAVSPEQVAAYRRDGHVTLRGVCSAEEVRACRAAIVAAAERLNRESRPLAERDTYGKAFLQTMNLWEEDAEVARFEIVERVPFAEGKSYGDAGPFERIVGRGLQRQDLLHGAPAEPASQLPADAAELVVRDRRLERQLFRKPEMRFMLKLQRTVGP